MHPLKHPSKHSPKHPMTTRNFLIFSVAFWLIASFIMIIQAWDHVQLIPKVMITRYIYLMAVGLVVSSVLANIYKGGFFKNTSQRLLIIAVLCVVAAFFTALLVNPVTYFLSGADISQVHDKMLSSGTLYFGLFYAIWTALYFQLMGQSMVGDDGEGSDEGGSEKAGLSFSVEKNGTKRILQDHDICCIKANVDYVELITADNIYMIRDSLSNLESQLDPTRFTRVHRSAIVNGEKIENVVKQQGGVFEITLEGGQVVKSSRSYKISVEGILPPA